MLDKGLLINPAQPQWMEYPRPFFRGDTIDIAQALLGAWIARRRGNLWYGARIVETEAYLGRDDAAAHSWRGRRTARVEPMYQDGGHLYVFLVYGMHHCANVVTRPEGIAEAVLLRAAEGPNGLSGISLSGPGRLCAALGITKADSGIDLLSRGDVRIFQRLGTPPKIGVTPRIGVDYAGAAKHWPLRFFDMDSPAVSGPPRMKRNLSAR
jgi:DNA-3-methyladenine glycosylase